VNSSQSIFNCDGLYQSNRTAISAIILHPAVNDILLLPMLRWRSTMRELSAEARLHLYARSLSRRTGTGLHAAALYGAFAVIAAVLFGTLSIHPF
jgi:glutaredoxin 2